MMAAVAAVVVVFGVIVMVTVLRAVWMLVVMIVVMIVIAMMFMGALSRRAGRRDGGGALAAPRGAALGVRMVGAGTVMRVAAAVGFAVRMEALLHVQDVEMSDVVVPEVVVGHVDHFDFAETQANQHALKALEIQPALLAVAPEQLPDVELLLFL